MIRWTVVLGVLAAVVVVALAAWAWWHVPLLYPEPMPGGQESVRAEPTVAPSEGRERGRGKRSGVPRASRADTARRGKRRASSSACPRRRPMPTSSRGRCAVT